MQNFSYYLSKNDEYGEITRINYPIITASGLPGVKPGEIVIFETGETGQVLFLYEDYIEIILFSQAKLKIGTKLSRTDSFLSVPTGQELLGNMINPLGVPIGTRRETLLPDFKESRPIDVSPLGIAKRGRITKPLFTGTALVDLLIPLGKGQKQLVLGDRKTGKSSFVRTALKNQLQQGAIAIYAAIGKTKSEIKYLEEFMTNIPQKNKMLIVATSAFESPALTFIAPFTAMGIAEYFRDQGEEVILVFDDLLTHAKFYREFSLIAQTFPGRDSYPADIFHIHARLLERAGNFKHAEKGEVAISALPIVETQDGDLTSYIVSNLMSITDGHIFFDSNVFSKGRRPAINIPLSVTRVGKQTQEKLAREINRELNSFFALYEKVENLSHFGSELTENVKSILATGERIYAFFNQTEGMIIPPEIYLILFSVVWLNLLKDGPNAIYTIREELLAASEQEQTKRFLAYLLDAKSFNHLLKNVQDNKQQLFSLWTKKGN